MIAPWMIYTLLVGGLISLAALAAERALLLLRMQVRWVWTVALGLSLLVPCLGHFLPRSVDIPPAIERAMLGAARLVSPDKVLTWPYESEPQAAGFPYERVLLIGWAAASLGLAQLILYSMAILHGRRREWRRVRVDGVDALVTPDFGPAVLGWRRLEIVLPAWVLELADDARALVLRHEEEHLRKSDPRLLIHASLVVLVMPWNPGLWWQYRRLRRAIELDCDARVVRGGADVGRYGEVLLEAGGFCRRGGLPALAAFAERAGDLEARIKALTPRRGRWRAARVAGAALAAGAMIVVACMVPDPLSPSREIPKASVSSAVRSNVDTTSSTNWVRAETQGIYTNLDIVLFRSHEGKLLGSRYVRDVVDNVANSIPSDDIASIEIVKGKLVPNVGSVVVITLKPGRQLAVGTDDSFRRYLGMFSGCATLHFGGRKVRPGRDSTRGNKCR